MTKRLTMRQRVDDVLDALNAEPLERASEPEIIEAAIADAERDAVEWVCKDAGCNEQETASYLTRWQERDDE